MFACSMLNMCLFLCQTLIMAVSSDSGRASLLATGTVYVVRRSTLETTPLRMESISAKWHAKCNCHTESTLPLFAACRLTLKIAACGLYGCLRYFAILFICLEDYFERKKCRQPMMPKDDDDGTEGKTRFADQLHFHFTLLV